jgi:hypothetical protein
LTEKPGRQQQQYRPEQPPFSRSWSEYNENA